MSQWHLLTIRKTSRFLSKIIYAIVEMATNWKWVMNSFVETCDRRDVLMRKETYHWILSRKNLMKMNYRHRHCVKRFIFHWSSIKFLPWIKWMSLCIIVWEEKEIQSISLCLSVRSSFAMNITKISFN